MAITFDAALGSGHNSGLVTTSFTTTSAAAANARVVVIVSWFHSSSATVSVTVGGTSATNDKQLNNTSDRYAIFSLALGAGGLASGSTISATVASGPGGVFVAACSYNGTTGVDVTGSNTGTTSASWSTGGVTNTVADGVYVGGAGTDGTLTSESSTPTNGNERFDLFNATDNQGAVMQDLIVASTGSNALTGTWANTTGLTTQTMAVVVYKGSAGAPSLPPELVMAPPRR